MKIKTIGRPKNARTPTLITRVNDSTEKDPKQSVKAVVQGMGVHYGLIHQILTEV